MRITFVLPYAGPGGGIRMAAMHAEQLRRRGHTVCAVSTPLRPPSLADRVRALLRGESLPPIRPRDSFFDQTAVEHRIIERFRPIVDADVPDADVVIATWWETAEWVMGLSPAKGAKVVFIQGFEVRGVPSDARLEATWRMPLHKIVVSEWLRTIASARFGDTQASLVPNPVDTHLFNAPARGKQAEPTVGLVYGRHHCKGPDVLARAASMLVERQPNVRIVAFGFDPIPPELGMPSRVRFEQSPAQSRIVELYRSCDVWLSGSRDEGFGLPILEAMACRTPVVATPAGAAADLVGGGGGVLARPEDPESLAAGAAQILGMPDSDWRVMSQRAWTTAQAYAPERSAAQFEAALERAVERSRRGETAGGAGSKAA